MDAPYSINVPIHYKYDWLGNKFHRSEAITLIE